MHSVSHWQESLLLYTQPLLAHLGPDDGVVEEDDGGAEVVEVVVAAVVVAVEGLTHVAW